MAVDFKGLADDLLRNSKNFLFDWFPAGKLKGNEFVVGNLYGEAGDSLSINFKNGRWKDFASGESGGDLISLYAAKSGLSQIDAFKFLVGDVVDSIPKPARKAPAKVAKLEPVDRVVDLNPPSEHDCVHPKFGSPSGLWPYFGITNNLMGYVARYDPSGERKQIVPWTYSGGSWGMGQWNKPRPLYGLNLLASEPNKPVMLVEGEKAADAARMFAGHIYNVLTFSGGCQAVEYVDWIPLDGKDVLLWPDADRKLVKTETEADRYGVPIGDLVPRDFQPGYSAMLKISGFLSGHAKSIKIIDVGFDADRSDGWDASDAYDEGMNWSKFKMWATPNVYELNIQKQDIAPDGNSTPSKLPPKRQRPQLSVVNGSAVLKPDPLVLTTTWMARDWASEIITTDKGGAKSCYANAVCALEKDDTWDGVIGFDKFSNKTMVLRENFHGLPVGPWFDEYDLIVCRWLQLIGIGIAPQTSTLAVEAIAKANAFNPVHDYLNGLKWDGYKRIDRWLTDFCGATHSEYTSAVGEKWLIGAVARVFSPGCKMDTALVLEGPQGIGKSTVFATLGGAWFTDDVPDMHGKNAAESVGGAWIVEIAELAAMQKSEIESVKAFITRRVDRFRPAYGRRVIEYPRTSVFGGTSNGNAYLKDEENRRFWPVTISDVDFEGLIFIRDQLWAEAVAMYRDGSTWYLEGDIKNDAKKEQELRRQADIWEHVVAQYITESPWHDYQTGDLNWSVRAEPMTKVSIAEILENALNITVGRWTRADQMRVASCLKSIGWERRMQPDRSWKYEKKK